jgi:regulator of protease activity HflC (stomatin/prohibitin superfamily)
MKIGLIASIFVIALICLGLWGLPQYNVYSQRLDGEAQLAHAEYSKRIAVETAKAKLDAAQLDAKTDIARAEGVAAANKILAESLGGPEGYLRWKYIEMLETTANSGRGSIIYVPTEAGLPILEAGRHKSEQAGGK